MAAQHLFNTFEPTFESSPAHLDPLRQVSGRLAHLCGMTSDAIIRELFEPVLTLAELANYLHVPAQTIYDLRAKGGGPRGFRVGRCLHFRKHEIDAWLAEMEAEDRAEGASRSHR